MTIATQFFHYQSADPPVNLVPGERCSPNLHQILNYLRSKWGGVSLGCLAKRPIRGGTSRSSHYWGAALDWRWEAHPTYPLVPFISRETLDVEVLPFLIENSVELGIQALHDEGRIWRAWRPLTSGGPGWRNSNTEYNGWIHIEVYPTAWLDDRPVEERLSVPTPIPISTPVPIPAPVPKIERFTMQLTKTVLDPAKRDQLRGSHDVALFQIYANGLFDAKLSIDKDYGPLTVAAARVAQNFAGVPIDGVIGPISWAAFLNASGK